MSSNAIVSIDSDDGRDDGELSEREEAFVYAYLTMGMNKSRAYRHIAPGVPVLSSQTLGSKMFARPRVKAKIAELLNEHAMTAAEVITEIGNIARASISDVFEWMPEHQMVVFDPAKAFETGAIHHMKQMKKNQDGTMTIVMHDKLAALTLLAKLHGLLLDTESDGEAAPREIVFYLPENPRDKEQE